MKFGVDYVKIVSLLKSYGKANAMQGYSMIQFWICWCSFSLVVLTGCVIPSLKNEPAQDPVVQKEYIGLSEERQDLAVEIESLKMQYDTLTVYNANIPSIVNQQQQKLEQLLRKLKDSGSDLNAIRDEMKVCREIQAYCFAQNHPSYTEGEVYRYEPSSSPERYQRPDFPSKEEITSGTGDSSGEVLSAGEFQNQALRQRNTGVSVETDRAAKTETIRSCFNIRKNSIAKPSTRTIQMAIVGPDGQVLTGKKSGTTSINGTQVQYSESREVEYQQSNTDVCMNFSANEGYEYKRGNYKIYIYEDGNMIGSSSITLK